MVILLFGKSGQVGWELQRALAPLGNIIALDRNSLEYCGDLSNLTGIAETIRIIKPDVVINAAAYTSVDNAEIEPKIAELINAISVSVIAEESKKVGAWFVHYSTDYVFPGSGEIPWLESDRPSPLNYYGKSKLNGEKAVQDICSKYLIIRTSWVYSRRGNNFIKTMLRLGVEREQLSVINDQFGAPTSADLIADCTAHIIHTLLNKSVASGVYHLVANGVTTWYDYATFIFDEARDAGIKLSLSKLNAISASSYMTPAVRPTNSRLNTEKIQKTFNLTLPDWKYDAKRILNEIFVML